MESLINWVPGSMECMKVSQVMYLKNGEGEGGEGRRRVGERAEEEVVSHVCATY